MRVRLSRCRRCGEQVAHSKRSRVPSLDGTRRHAARGLCAGCYDSALAAGQLERYPLLVRSSEEVLEAVARARRSGPADATLHDVAAGLGMTHAALEQVLVRARRLGDERARWRGTQWRAGRFGPLDSRR